MPKRKAETVDPKLNVTITIPAGIADRVVMFVRVTNANPGLADCTPAEAVCTLLRKALDYWEQRQQEKFNE